MIKFIQGAGFTLIEVMIAAVILTVGVTGVFGAYFSIVDNLKVGKNSLIAACLVKEKMTDIEMVVLSGGKVVPGVENGEFRESSAGFNWTSNVWGTDIYGLDRVRVEVVNSQAPGRGVSVQSYVENNKNITSLGEMQDGYEQS